MKISGLGEHYAKLVLKWYMCVTAMEYAMLLDASGKLLRSFLIETDTFAYISLHSIRMFILVFRSTLVMRRYSFHMTPFTHTHTYTHRQHYGSCGDGSGDEAGWKQEKSEHNLLCLHIP